MEIPSPYSAWSRKWKLKVRDKVSQGSLVLLIETGCRPVRRRRLKLRRSLRQPPLRPVPVAAKPAAAPFAVTSTVQPGGERPQGAASPCDTPLRPPNSAWMSAQVKGQLDYKQIGNVSRGGNVLLIRKDAPLVASITPSGAAGVWNQRRRGTWMGMVLLGKEILGWNVRWVPGYSGTSDMELGLQRGEVDMLGTSNSFVIDRLKKEGLAIPITQTGTYKQGKFRAPHRLR